MWSCLWVGDQPVHWVKLVENLFEGEHCVRGRGTSQGAWIQTQEGMEGIWLLSVSVSSQDWGAGGPSINCPHVHFSSSLCIVNDELFVREASPSEAQRLHSPSQCLHCRPLSCSTSPLSSMKWCGLSPPSVESPLIFSEVTAGFAWSWEGTGRSGQIINGNLKVNCFPCLFQLF